MNPFIFQMMGFLELNLTAHKATQSCTHQLGITLSFVLRFAGACTRNFDISPEASLWF